MLSVRSRDDGRKELGLGLGFGGGGGGRRVMEENELEEGEACSGQDDDNCIDPDVALSYIDEKLQDVLGHFQKDFEGGVSAENLGAKFGGYGSFLPSYQRSPSIWPQPRSPPKAPNVDVSRSPYNSSLEGARQNHSVLTSACISKNNNARTSQSFDNSGKKFTSKFSSGEAAPQQDSINKAVNSSDQKTLKVRIKVGSDNSSARNNADIYSGLGLDISPSSSPEDSPDRSGGLSPEFQDEPGESPITIVQIMTCFSVPGGYLLSPLPDSVLQLSKKESAFIKNSKTGMLQKGIPETCTVVADLTLPMRYVKGFIERKMKPDDKSGRIMEAKSTSIKDDKSTILKREIDNETLEGQKLVSDTLNTSILSGSRGADIKIERQLISDSAKATSRLSDHSKEPNKLSVKDRVSSPDLLQDNKMESIENIKNAGICNSGNETSNLRGKLSSKTSMEEEERNLGNHKDILSDMSREGMIKVEKSYGLCKSDSVGYKPRKNHITGSAEPLKHMFVPTSYEQDGERISQVTDQLTEGKRKISQTNGGTSEVELTKENLQPVSSVVLKEKKKSSHAKRDHSDNKSKKLKSHKEASKGRSKESHRDTVGAINAEQVQYRTDFLETSCKEKPNHVMLEHQKGSFTFTEKSKDQPGVKKVDRCPIAEVFVDAPGSAPLTSNAPGSYAAAAPQAPVVIEENWVLCDICQEWRLLPYGTDPAHLPRKWQCNMQTWLPGLNRCHISEAVTTKALNALYLVPVPESDANLNDRHEIASSNIISANVLHLDQRLERNMQTVPTIEKKKPELKDESNVQTSTKNRSLNDTNEFSSDTNFLTKFSLGNTSKSIDYTVEKHNIKQKDLGRYSDGGDLIEKNGKHSKSKSKREGGQDGSRSSKRIKKNGSGNPVEDRHSNFDAAGRDAHSTDNGFSSKASGKNSQKYGYYSPSKDLKSDPKGHLPTSIKKQNNEVHAFSSGDLKEHFSASDVIKSAAMDFSAKKRKMKEWQASQDHHETLMSSHHMSDDMVIAKEVFSESELRKQKKAKVSKSEGKESGTSKADGRMDMSSSTRILLSGSRAHPLDGMDEGRGVAGKEPLGQDHGSAISKRVLDCTDYMKRDLVYAQPPAAATSSSSKVSGSRKSKANIQEARGSPVGSVSSSPLRTSNIDKLSTRRNKVVKDVAHIITGNLKGCSDGEADGASDRSGARRKERASSVQQRSLGSYRAAESGVLDSLRGTHDLHDKEANQLSNGKIGDGMHLKSDVRDDPSPPLIEDTNVVSGHGNISGQRIKYNREANYIHNQDKMNNHHHANGQPKSGKSSSLRFKEKNRSSKSDVDKGKFKASDFIKEQKESHFTKNGNSCRPEADIDSHGRSTYHEDSRDENYNAQEIKDEEDYSETKDSTVKCFVVGRGDGLSNYVIQENLDICGPSMLPKQHKDFDSRVAGASCSKSNVQEALQQTPSQQDEKSSIHFLSDRFGRPEMSSGRGKFQPIQPSKDKHEDQPSKDKHEEQSRGPLTVPTPVKGSRSEVYPNDAVSGDASKVIKQSRKPDIQNGLRQATTNCLDASSPIRKDGHPAATAVLKEAIDLKHTANRLKNEGLELESTGLYFEAALKFLHVASLLEPPNLQNSKHGEATQSMKMYSETARLCEFCAHVYERCKEMFAAALAYKCVEVAYMKVAYYKNPSASKDRHELQAALQIAPPGESPSSSASDVDNLNNQGALDKSAPTKGTASPQIAGNHVIAAHNRPNFMRLLNYTNDLNCALEATRKSQNAIAAAIVNLGKDGVDGMSSVKKVLDFNFHNVEGLLRLVRLSMESISL